MEMTLPSIPAATVPAQAKLLALDDHMWRCMAQDLACKIYPADEIAARYGFADKAALRAWIAAHPDFYPYVKRLQALNESDENVLERIKQKAAHALEDALPELHSIAKDPNTGAKEKIEAIKVKARLSGADAYVQPPKEGQGGGGGGQVLNFAINFAGMAPQIISTTVVDPAAIPDLSDNQDDGDSPDEDA